MNNVVKKNILYSLSTNYDLPYQTKNDVSLKANQIIYTSINNNLQKLVDNDLYTERMLLDTYNYPIGPKEKTDVVLSSSEDGYKMWDGLTADSLSILHKHVTDVSSTIQKISISGLKVNFILDVGEYLAGTNQGLYRSKDGKTWDNTKSGCLSTGYICSKYVEDGNEQLFFGTNFGLYQLSNAESLGFDDELTFVRKDSDSSGLYGKYINSITIDDTMNDIYLGTDIGLYVGKNIDDIKVKDNFNETYLEEYEIMDLKNLSSGVTLAMTKNDGIFERTLQYGLSGLTQITSPSVTFYKLKGKYVLTSRGLYEINGNSITIVSPYGIYGINDILETGSDLYVATKSGLFKNGQVIDSSTDITVLGEYNDLLIIGQGTSLYYVDKSKTTDASTMTTWKKQIEEVESTVLAIQVYDTQLYVSTDDGVYVFDESSSTGYGIEKKSFTIAGGSCEISEKVNFIQQTTNETIYICTDGHVYSVNGGVLQQIAYGYNAQKLINENGMFLILEQKKIHILDEYFRSVSVFENDESMLDICLMNGALIVTTVHNLYRYEINDGVVDVSTMSKLFPDDRTDLLKTVQTGDTTYLISQSKIFILTSNESGQIVKVENLDINTYSVRNNPKNSDIMYFSTENGLKYSSTGPEGTINDLPQTVLLQSGIKDVCFSMRVDMNKMYATTGSGLKYCNSYFDIDGILSSTDAVFSTPSLEGKKTTVLEVVQDTAETDDSTYMFVGTEDSGLYYNKTSVQKMEYAYPWEANALKRMESRYVTATGSTVPGLIPDVILGSSSSGNNVFSLWNKDNLQYTQTTASVGKTINNIYDGYIVNAETEEEVVKTDVQSFMMVAANGAFLAYPIKMDDANSGSAAIETTALTANGTTGKNVKFWATSGNDKNYLLDATGKFLYNITDSLEYILDSSTKKTFTAANNAISATGVLDICVPQQNMMYLSKSDGLYKFSNLTSDIKGSTPAKRVNTDATSAKRLVAIDGTKLMAVTSSKYFIINTSTDATITSGSFEGTLTNVQNLDEAVEIYTSSKIYTYNKGTGKISSVGTMDAETRITKKIFDTTFNYTNTKFFFYGLNEDFNYQKLSYEDMNFTEVRSLQADNSNCLYMVADNAVYKFTSNFLTQKPEKILLDIPASADILQLFITTIGNIFYCVYEAGKLKLLEYYNGELVKTTTIPNYTISNFNKFYVENDTIYILQNNGNNKITVSTIVGSSYTKDIPSQYTGFSDATYFNENPIIGTNKGIIEYDVASDTIRYFNEQKLSKTPISRIFNCGDVYAACGTTGVSSFSDTQEFQEYTYLSGKVVTQFLNDYSIGMEDGMFMKYSYEVKELDKSSQQDFILSKMWEYGGKLYSVVKDGCVKTISHYQLQPFNVVIEGESSYINDMFVVNSHMIYVKDGVVYDGGTLLENVFITPQYMYGNGYGWFIGSNKLYRYDNISKCYRYDRIDNVGLDNIEINQTLIVDGNMILFGSDGGLKRYDSANNVVEDIDYNPITFLKEDYNEVDEYTEEVKGRYLYGVGNKVYKVYIGELYNDPEYVTEIYKYPNEKVRDVVIVNKYEALYGGDSGLYRTNYTYCLKDDFYTGEVSSVVNSISASYKDIIEEHLVAYHGNGSTITRLNNKMPADMSDTSQLQENGSIADIRNNVEFEDYNKYITASARNENGDPTLSVANIDGISYIKMCNINGVESDIYINIPTTNTYYLPHMYGVPNCEHDSDTVTHDNTNITTSRNINENVTYVEIMLNNQHFEIQEINSVEVNGTSLPMKIFKNSDTERYPDGVKFCSLIKPSILYGFPDDITEDYAKITIMCFGTDEQCVHIRTTNIKTYIITYMYTDGSVFTERKYKTFTPKEAEITDEIVGGSIFKGWNIDGKRIYTGENIDIDVQYIGQKFTAYPIFEEYEFDYSDSTIFTLQAQSDAFYINGDTISQQTVVDYDSIIDTQINVKSDKTTLKISQVEAINDQNIIVDWDYHIEDEM